jgi:two-component system, cell cycle sensor histidine kinase and response regulator CckA
MKKHSNIQKLPLKRELRCPPYVIEVIYNGQDPIILEINEKPIVKRNKVTGMIGTARDVTRKIEAEKALKKSENLFSVFMDHLPAGVFIKDEYTNIQYVNKFMKETFGADGWVGRSAVKCLSDEQIQAIADYDWQLLQHGPLIYEDQFLGKDNKRHYYQTYQFPIRKGEKDRLIGSIAYDITQQKELELQLQQAQKMESIGRLAGGIAHDFNNLLTAISGHADLLLLSMDEQDPNIADVEEIMQTTHRAAKLARQLLIFSRQQLAEPQIVNLNQVIDDLNKMLICIIGEDITVKTEFAEDLLQVKIDPLQIEQVLLNLAVNARDAMPRGGGLVIATRNMVPKISLLNRGKSDQYVVLSITDTGEGMSEDIKSHIFEPFFTTKPEEQGTGLGLSIVYGVVAQNGGYINVDSVEGVGSRFNIYLPAVKSGKSMIPDVNQERVKRSGTEHILVVEDEGLVRKALVRSLEACGYTVVGAADAQQAMGLCDEMEKPVDLILTDLVMPHMRGDEFACKIKQRWPTVKIVLMSGYMNQADEQSCMVFPKMNYMQKPFKPQELQERIRKILDDDHDLPTQAMN